MTKIIAIAILLFCTTNVWSQDIDIKKGVIYADGKEVMKLEGNETKGFSFYLAGEEVLFMNLNNWQGNNRWKLTFVKENKVLFPSTLHTRKDIVEKLIKDKILLDGKWNSDKIDVLISKYEQSH